MPLADFRQVLDVNAVGCWLGMKAAIEPMKRVGGGSIVNISSIEGFTGAEQSEDILEMVNAGLVKVTMTCKHDVKRVVIDPSLLGEDKDMLEDLVIAAMNDAVAPVAAMYAHICKAHTPTSRARERRTATDSATAAARRGWSRSREASSR